MAKITAYVKNTTNTDYRVHVFDQFGGGRAEVPLSPFAVAAGDTSDPFPIQASADGTGVLAYACERGPSLDDNLVTDGSTVNIA